MKRTIDNNVSICTRKIFLQVAYGDNFNGKVGSNAAATTYWQNALVHVQAHYCHSSLGSKIKISTLSVTHISGTKLTASEASAKAMETSNSARLKGADLMVYMVKNNFENLFVKI